MRQIAGLKVHLKTNRWQELSGVQGSRGQLSLPFFFFISTTFKETPLPAPSRIRLRVAQSFPKKSSMPRETGKWLWQIFWCRIAQAIGEVVRGRRGTGQKRACLHRCSRAADSAEDSDCHWLKTLWKPGSLWGCQPAAARCWAREAEEMFFRSCRVLPVAFLAENVDLRAARKHTELVEVIRSTCAASSRSWVWLLFWQKVPFCPGKVG